MVEQLITVPCKIIFSSGRIPTLEFEPADRENSTIKFLFEDIPFTFSFRELYEFDMSQDGDKVLKLAKLYVTDDKTICSLLDIRNYCHTGRFAPPNDGREIIRPDQVGYEDNDTRTLRIIDELYRGTDLTTTSWGRLKLAVTLNNFIYIINVSSATVDREYLKRLYPEPFDDYYNKSQQDNPENIIFKIFQKLYQKFPQSFDAIRIRRVGGKKKNGRRSCRTRYKAKHAKHSKSKKRYRKSKKRMLRS
jgi:hypothetical protein